LTRLPTGVIFSTRMQRLAPDFWTAVFTGLLALITLVAVLVGYFQLRAFRTEARVQHLLQLDEKFTKEPMLSYRHKLAEKRLRNEKDPDELYQLLDFFETVGLLVKRGYLDEDDLWNTFSYSVFVLNADARQNLEQDQRDDPTTYAEFTYLVKCMERIEAKNHGTFAHPSKEEIEDYWKLELVGTSTPTTPRIRKPKVK
jgi:hypothetical protein